MSENTNTNSENADNLAQNEELFDKEAMADFLGFGGGTESREQIEKLQAEVAELKDKNIRKIKNEVGIKKA